MDHQTDEALFRAYREGDESAFTALVERHAGELVQFLVKQTGSRAAAEDVFQETFLRSPQPAGTFDLDRRFKPWLYTIAVNKGRDWHRRNARRKAVSLSANVGSDGEGQSFVDLLASDAAEPGEGLQDAELRTRVKTVVDDMPEHYREILPSYFQKMSYMQIAEAASSKFQGGIVKSPFTPRSQHSDVVGDKASPMKSGNRMNNEHDGTMPELCDADAALLDQLVECGFEPSRIEGLDADQQQRLDRLVAMLNLLDALSAEPLSDEDRHVGEPHVGSHRS